MIKGSEVTLYREESLTTQQIPNHHTAVTQGRKPSSHEGKRGNMS